MGGLRLGLMAGAAFAASFVITGCSHVAPYERGILAQPTMSADDVLSMGVDNHVRAVSEGATGGFAGGGGGCSGN